MRYTESKFRKFLKSVDLNHYRNKYSKIKTVEMDLPRNIQALDTIYDVYWKEDYRVENGPLNFDDFYNKYYEKCKKEINEFRSKTGFGKECDCFERGLKARIYRTWASIITQVHAGYVAESVFGKNSIKQGTELDHKGVDIQATYKGSEIKIQVKKESKRPEIARMQSTETNDKGYYNIWYVVPTENDYNNPTYKIGKRKGELRDCIKSFKKYDEENGTLDRLDNGFVIFTKKEFELIKQNVDNN